MPITARMVNAVLIKKKVNRNKSYTLLILTIIIMNRSIMTCVLMYTYSKLYKAFSYVLIHKSTIMPS